MTYKFDLKKIEENINEFLDELGSEDVSSHHSASECTTEEIELENGRRAQIKIIVNTDERDFEDVC